MADLARIKRNVAKMAAQSAPEAEIDSYLAAENTTPDAIRSFKDWKGGPSQAVLDTVNKDEKLGNGFGLSASLADKATLGAMNPLMAAVGATGKTVGKLVTGQEPDWLGDYQFSRDVDDEKLRRYRGQQEEKRPGAPQFRTGVTVSPETLLSLPFVPGKAIDIGLTLGKQMVQAAKYGAGYGAIQGLNEARGGVGEHLEQAAEHGLTGAVFGPAFHSGVNLFSRVPNALSNALKSATGRSPEAVNALNANLAENRAAGVSDFVPAATDNRLFDFASRGLASRKFIGAPLREQAEGSISDVSRRAQELINQQTGGLPSNDVGAGIQATLRRNMTETTIPRPEIAAMPEEQLGRLTGQPPRPVADPVPPRTVQDALPEPVNPKRLQYDVAAPENVPAAPVHPELPPMESVPIPRDHQRSVDRAERRFQIEDRRHGQESDAFHELARSKGEASEALWNKLHEQDRWTRAGQFARPAPNTPEWAAYQRVNDANMAKRAAEADFATTREVAEQARKDLYKSTVVRDHEARITTANREYDQQLKVARDAANLKTEAARAKAAQEAEAEAQQVARQRTEEQRQMARSEAERETRRTQADLDMRYEGDRSNRLASFKPGASKESYPTEFSAAYEALNRETPTFQRNPLGSKAQPDTATARLLHDFALEARGTYELPGYSKSTLFGRNAEESLHPGLSKHLSSLLGRDIALKIEKMAASRKIDRFAPGDEGLRDLATMIRRARQSAEKAGSSPSFPGEPRPARAAALRRLEGALKSDYHNFVRETGPKGQRLSEDISNVDAQYGQHIETMRKPLAKIFGDKVQPIEAMDRLVSAAQDGNLALIRPFMKVMAQKSDPMLGAGAIVAHVTQGAKTMGDFLKGYRSIPREVRAELFHSPEGRALQTQLDRLEKIGTRLEPYQRTLATAANDPGIRPSQIALGIGLYTHFFPTMLAYGGSHVMARFMASPKYLRWLNDVPQVRTPGQWTQHMHRLGALAERDSESGADIRSAVGRMTSALNPVGKAHATFVGESAFDHDPESLEAARKDRAAGATEDQIWQKHGWKERPDGNAMREIDDGKAVVTPVLSRALSAARMTGKPQTVSLSDILKHEELYKAHPLLKDYKVTIGRMDKDTPKDVVGLYDWRDLSISLNAHSGVSKDQKEMRKHLLHEVQHAISHIEEFYHGDEEKTDVASYWRKPGEADAYNVARRADMSAADKRRLHPGRTVTPPEDQQDWGDHAKRAGG